MVELEQSAEVHRIVAAMARQEIDFEAWESLILQAARKGGAGALGALLQKWQRPSGDPVRCACGQVMHSRGRRTKRLITVLGTVPFSRSSYYCGQCAGVDFPCDRALQIEGTMYSPGTRRLMARAGGQTDFKQASDDLLCYAGLALDAREIERIAEEVGRQIEHWMGQELESEVKNAAGPEAAIARIPKFYISFDGTGIPMRQSELTGRRGKRGDGTARTREVKLGCVFTQVGLNAKGYPEREADSTTYVAAIESSECFGWRIYAEARRRGLDRAQQIIVITDGARYNRTIAQTHFPEAIHIVDLYHAFEHLGLVAKALWGVEASAPEPWRRLLKAGKIEQIIATVAKQLPSAGAKRKAAQKALNYFENNKDQMRYGDYRRKKLFVGSGVVEAGCRTVIGQRLKHSGMRWSLRGANAIIALRCCLLSGRFEDFWAAQQL